mgnify:CR=1 FL=1
MTVPLELVIRRMELSDCPFVLALEESCGLSSWGLPGYERELANSDSILLVAYSGSSLAGFLSGRVIADEFELFSLAVAENIRRRGLGKSLLEAGLLACRDSGVDRCFLEVRASNGEAISLYEKIGFQVVGRRRNYYSHPPEDGILMLREAGKLAV